MAENASTLELHYLVIRVYFVDELTEDIDETFAKSKPGTKYSTYKSKDYVNHYVIIQLYEDRISTDYNELVSDFEEGMEEWQ